MWLILFFRHHRASSAPAGGGKKLIFVHQGLGLGLRAIPKPN